MSGVTRRLPGGPRGRGEGIRLSLWDRMVVGTHCVPRLPLGTIIIYVHPCTHLYIPCGRPSDACRECTGGSVQTPIPGGHPQHPVAVRIELYRNLHVALDASRALCYISTMGISPARSHNMDNWYNTAIARVQLAQYQWARERGYRIEPRGCTLADNSVNLGAHVGGRGTLMTTLTRDGAMSHHWCPESDIGNIDAYYSVWAEELADPNNIFASHLRD